MEQNIKTPKFPKLEGVLASRGLSYPVVAKGIGMGDQAFRRRMSGEANFTLDEILELCFFLNCNFSEIFGD